MTSGKWQSERSERFGLNFEPPAVAKNCKFAILITKKEEYSCLVLHPGVIETGHSDGDPDKTQDEYDDDNRSDQLNPNNDEYQGDDE